MSAATVAEQKKIASPASAPARTLLPPDRPDFAPPVEDFQPASLQTESAAGHDLGSLAIQAAPERTAAQDCPLPAGPRACPFGGACHTCPLKVQAKLAVGAPDDEYERGADRAAEWVMRMPEDGMLQRQCASCGEEDEEEVVRTKAASALPRSAGEKSKVPPIVHEALQSPGRPLDDGTRSHMETLFGWDFGRVRVHTESRAAQSSRAVNALAYTVGHDMVFAAGRYSPGTSAGRKLIAHELAHTIQQGKGNPAEPHPDDHHEFPLRRCGAEGFLDRKGWVLAPQNTGFFIQKYAAEQTGASSTDARTAAQDDGATGREAMEAVTRRIGEARLNQLLRGIREDSDEAEAERAAERIASGRPSPRITSGTGAPRLQAAGPAIVIGAALMAMAVCAFGFYFYAMDHYGDRDDSWLHCYTSCKIATWCAPGTVTALIGLGKEALDYVCDLLGGPCGAEWRDVFNNLRGIGCAYRFWRTCTSCCD